MSGRGHWPHYADDEIEAVTEVLRSGRVNQWGGHYVDRFEAELATYFAAPHAVAVSNGSVALEIALRALGVGPGDEVIVTPRSFVASVSCVALVGATPVFADISPDTQNLTPDTIAAAVTPRTRAIIPVHLAGWPCDMPAIMDIADHHDLLVLEDCAQAHGATLAGRKAGSFGDAAAFSFCLDKIISTGGEGGAILFRDEDTFRRAWAFKDHGKNLTKVRTDTLTPGFRWLVDTLGTNARMTEMQAAIGVHQLAKLDAWLTLRHRNAMIWAEALAGVPALRIPLPSADVGHAWYKFYAFLRPEVLPPGVDRDAVLRELEANNLRAFSGSCPEIYAERAFEGLNVALRPVARRLGQTSLMFEVHPTLDADDLRAQAQKTRDVIVSLTTSK